MKIVLVMSILLGLLLFGCTTQSNQNPTPSTNYETGNSTNLNSTNVATNPTAESPADPLTYGLEKKESKACITNNDCNDGLDFTLDNCLQYTSQCIHVNTLPACGAAPTCSQISDPSLKDKCFYESVFKMDNIVPGGPKIELPNEQNGGCCFYIKNDESKNICINEILTLEPASVVDNFLIQTFKDNYKFCKFVNLYATEQDLYSKCLMRENDIAENYSNLIGCDSLTTSSSIDMCAMNAHQCDLITNQSLKDNCLYQKTKGSQ